MIRSSVLSMVTGFLALVGCTQSPDNPAPSPSPGPATGAVSPSDAPANVTPAASNTAASDVTPAATSMAPSLPQPSEPTLPITHGLVQLDGINADQWIATTEQKAVVNAIPLTCRIAETVDGLHFENLHREAIFRFRPILRRRFVVRFKVVLDEGIEDISKVTWAAGTCSARSGKLEFVIPATANLEDGETHAFEFAYGPTEASLRFDGHLCKTITQAPESQPSPRQFFLFARQKFGFTVREFEVFTDEISFDDSVEPRAVTTTPGIRPQVFQQRPPIEGETPVHVGGDIARAELGNDGKLLVLHNQGKQSLQILDVAKRSLIHEIPLPDESVLMAVGRNSVITYYKNLRQLVSRSLETFEIVATKEVPEDYVIEHMTLGASSTAPLLTIREDPEVASKLEFLDPFSLEPIEIEVVQPEQRPLELHQVIRIRSNPTGQIYGIAARQDSNSVSSGYAIQLEGNRAQIYDPYQASGFAGSNAFGPKGVWPSVPVTSFDDNFRLEIKQAGQPNNGFVAVDSVVDVMARGMQKPLTTIQGLDLTADNQFPFEAKWGNGDLMKAERLHLIESLNTIITIPRTNRHVVFRDYNLAEEIAKRNEPYFYFGHQPILQAYRGEKFRAQLKLYTNQNLEAYFLSSFTGNGRGVQFDNDKLSMTWDVPKEAADKLQLNVQLKKKGGHQVGSEVIIIQVLDGPKPRKLPEQVVAAQPTPMEPAEGFPLRTWTDVQGRTMTARLIKRVGDLVKVQTEDGKDYTLPVSRFSESDIEYIDQASGK